MVMPTAKIGKTPARYFRLEIAEIRSIVPNSGWDSRLIIDAGIAFMWHK
jgi:hypothetical protein